MKKLSRREKERKLNEISYLRGKMFAYEDIEIIIDFALEHSLKEVRHYAAAQAESQRRIISELLRGMYH